MINNEFHMVGVATSNFIDVSSQTFKKHIFNLEVEAYYSKVGAINKFEIEVYGSNMNINTNKIIKGKQLIVDGYITSITKKENEEDQKIFPRLIASNMLVVDMLSKPMVARMETIQAPKESDMQEINVVAEDDELPF